MDKSRKKKPCDEVCLKWLIWGIIGGEFLTLVFCVIVPWGGPFGGSMSFATSLIACVGLFLIVRSYRIANSVESFAPRDWVPPNATPEELERAKQAAISQTSSDDKYDRKRRALDHYNRIRYCVHCQAFKPPRTHHCKDCGRCVLKLDHHCLPAGTLVSLPSGLSMPIERLCESGQTLQSFDAGSGQMTYAGKTDGPVFKVHEKPQTCCRVSLVDGTELVCTPDHPVLTSTGQYIQAASLVPAHHSVVCSSLGCVNDVTDDVTSNIGKWDWSNKDNRATILAFARLSGAYACLGEKMIRQFDGLNYDQMSLDLLQVTGNSSNKLPHWLTQQFPTSSPTSIAAVLGKWPQSCSREFLASFLSQLSRFDSKSLVIQWQSASSPSSTLIRDHLDGVYGIRSTQMCQMSCVSDISSLLNFITCIGVRYNSTLSVELDSFRRWQTSHLPISFSEFKRDILHQSSTTSTIQVKQVIKDIGEKKIVYDLTVPHYHNFVASTCVTHNCPWMTGCVAYNNHKAFVLFLFYAVFGMAVCAAFNICELVFMANDTNRVSLPRIVFMVLSLAFSAPFGLGLLPLLGSQVYSVCINETTMEDYIHSRIRHYDRHFKNPYNMGFVFNWKTFFGQNPLKWLWPDTPSSISDAGLSYPTRRLVELSSDDRV